MIGRLSAKLNHHEQRRAAGFAFEKDRAIFVVAHALLRHALAPMLDGDTICFRANAYGKPELDLDHEHGIHFNLSHTRGMAVCAICRGHPVGVDVEAIDRSVDVEWLAERHFAPQEYQLILEAPLQQRVEIFFRLWTLKEAMLKAVGTGLATPLQEFAFTLEPETSKMQLARAKTASEWQVHEYVPTADHRLALAVHRPSADTLRVVSRHISPEELG